MSFGAPPGEAMTRIVWLGNYAAKNLTDYRDCGQHHGTGIPEEHPHDRFFFVQYRSQDKMNAGFSADLFNVLPHRVDMEYARPGIVTDQHGVVGVDGFPASQADGNRFNPA